MKITRFINFFKEVNSEAYRISWPSFRDTLVASFLVFTAVLLSALIFLMIDGVVYKLINYVLAVDGG